MISILPHELNGYTTIEVLDNHYFYNGNQVRDYIKVFLPEYLVMSRFYQTSRVYIGHDIAWKFSEIYKDKHTKEESYFYIPPYPLKKYRKIWDEILILYKDDL